MTYSGEQKRRYQREWIAARRASYFADKSCVVCGSTEGLELDHIDPSIKITHRIWSWSEGRRIAEIAKCQVLCSTHHKEKTRAQIYKRFCWRGHDKEVVGIESDKRTCSECRRMKDRRLRAEGKKK